MKRITIIILFLIFTENFSQNNFIKTVDAKKNEPMLVGEISESAFLDSAFFSWFNEETEYYAVDTIALSKIKNLIDDIKIEIIMGTWCSDSRREVPHFLKLIKYLKLNEDRFKIIAVDRTKKDLNNYVDKYNIELVPTFIILKDSKEIGRIVETPTQSLELDLAEIILGTKN